MIRLAIVYFAVVFATGFVLGTLRVLLLVPTLGARYAELLEIPVMLSVVFISGRWVASKAKSSREAWCAGLIALLLLLGAELILAAVLFGKTPMDALFNKDLVSGTAYYLSLIVFAAVPGICSRSAACVKLSSGR